jgi:hypothetical protein
MFLYLYLFLIVLYMREFCLNRLAALICESSRL